MNRPSHSARLDRQRSRFVLWVTTGMAAPLAITLAATWTWLAEGLAIGIVRDSARAVPLASWPAVWAAHVAGAALMGAALLVSWSVGRFSPSRYRGLAVAATAVAMALLPSVRLGRILASGDWISRQAFAPLVQWVVPSMLIVPTFVIAWSLGRDRAKAAPTWTFGVASAASFIADASVLPGLYAAAHTLFYVVGTLAAVVAAWPLAIRIAAASRWKMAAGPPALVTVLGTWATLPFWSEHVRAGIAAGSPSLAGIIGLVFRVPMSHFVLHELEALGDKSSPVERGPSDATPIAPRPRSIVFIVVDTLRSDALVPVRRDGSFARSADTPFLNGYLAGAYRFRQAYSQASQTKRSMPPLFRSLHPFEQPTEGISLPEIMKRAGLRPVSVVPQYFLMPAQKSSQELLIGFERVAVYEKDHQEKLVPQAIELLRQVGQQPFFAWIHFYNMHEPYFADRPLSATDGGVAERYGRALTWLDGQISLLVAGIEELGLASSTLVVIASDHGEHLGEGRRTGHGDGVHEEEIHVPLAFRVPGAPGGIVDGLAGNIDIVPTMLDLIGDAPDPAHRGRSLLPLMREPHRPSLRSYYVQSGGGDIHAIVTGESKLVYAEKQRALYRYDRSPAPVDSDDRFGQDPRLDRALISELVRRNPALFRDELGSSDVVRLLRRRIDESDADLDTSAFGFLLRLASSSDDAGVRRAMERLFDRSQNRDTRAATAGAMFSTDPAGWSHRLESLLTRERGADGEASIVKALASNRLPPFALGFARRRLAAFGPDAFSRPRESRAARAWLALTAPWKKPVTDFAEPLAAMLGGATRTPRASNDDLGLLLRNVATLEPAPGESRITQAGDLETLVLPLLADADPTIAIAACQALGRVGETASVERLYAALTDRTRDPRIVQAALLAYADLRGRQAVSELIAQGTNPLLTVDVIHLLGKLGDARAIPFLEGVAREHYNAWTRGQASAALEAIRGGPAREPGR